ncbi:MAG: S8 family peptidase [Deltaproteobacteria bacterium]|nr:S8 family peptidase [Deltaproteobacteria bacterium]
MLNKIPRENIVLFSGFVVAAFLLTLVNVFSPVTQATENAGSSGILVLFDRPPGPEEHKLARNLGGRVKYSFHIIPGIAIADVPSTACQRLSRNPRVLICTADGEVQAIDAELDNTWGVKRIGAGTVHDSGNKGTDIKVAVIDSGVDYNHPDITANFAGGYDFVNDDTDPMDDNGHGTHVTGTVAALDNDVGVVGVGPEISIYALKILNSSGSGSWSDAIAALDWAVNNGIQVTNNSYGSGSDPGDVVEAAFDAADAAGILNVAAAGNSGNCAGKGDNVGYPARFASVIAVAATNQDDKRPCFSSTGPDVELAAPGVGINSTLLDGGYGTKSGTSMASPHVAGTAALVIATGITDTNGNGRINDEVRQLMNDTAEDLGVAGRDPHYGFGLVSAAAAAVGPPEPAVNVALATDKTDYISGEDTVAVLSAVVTDEGGNAISGLSSSAFVTTLDGVEVAVTFTETATPGTYTTDLDISGLADGDHTVLVTVTDTRGVSGTGLASFSIGPAPTESTTAIVDSITYSTSGGKNSDRHLKITLAIVDDLGNPVAGASVSITLKHDSGESWSGTGTTGTNGTVIFSLKNAPAGCYETTVTDVTAEGLTWDGVTPANGFCK